MLIIRIGRSMRDLCLAKRLLKGLLAYLLVFRPGTMPLPWAIRVLPGNAQHHARAHSVAIEIVLEKPGLRLTVADDSAAAPKLRMAEPKGLGIRGMQARFAQLGGELIVTHRPSGATVEGFLPR